MRPGDVMIRQGAGPADDLAAAALSLARCFAAGARMWCTSPQWPAHGHHVAVEFVHPVIVGKRALPAVCIDGADAASTLRLLARRGDVLLTVSSAGDRSTDDLVARAGAWGLTRICLGAGPRPDLGHADHVVWLEDVSAAQASRSGDLVLLYHLLWELTHVVFEHPGLLDPVTVPAAGGCGAGPGDHCITCSDEGSVAEVRAVHDSTADVVIGGDAASIDVSLVEPVGFGDLLLVHAGVAIASLGDPATPARDRAGVP